MFSTVGGLRNSTRSNSKIIADVSSFKEKFVVQLIVRHPRLHSTDFVE